MVINLTLFIQMVHFFFAYTLLKKFFFVPILQFIEQDKKQSKIVESIILNLEEQVISVKKKQQKQRDNLKAYFSSHQPDYAFERATKLQLITSNKLTFDNHGQEIVKFKEELSAVLQKKFWL